MNGFARWVRRQAEATVLAYRALRMWSPRQVIVATAAAVVVALIVGLVTVLIPNPVFARDIPPVPWNYPVWIVTSALTGILIATYIRPPHAPAGDDDARPSAESRRSARVGGAAGVLAWFAVGCPVCNKIALLALGYTGALTWFAPLQPVLAAVALVLAAVAVVWRLRGQVSCPTPALTSAVAA